MVRKIESLFIDSPTLSQDGQRIEATVSIGRKPYQVWYASTDLPLVPTLESFIAPFIAVSMKNHIPLIHANGTVNPGFLESLERVQDLMLSWKPRFRRVEIQVNGVVDKDPPKERRVGLFFSGGVDSSYSLLTHQDEITDLFTIFGFDINLDNLWLQEKAQAHARQVAQAFGKRSIIVSTNVVPVIKRIGNVNLSQAAIFASMIYPLAPFFERVYIASGFLPNTDKPWGVHKDIDWRWSVENLEFIHDTWGVSRIEKTARVAECAVLVSGLRICNENPFQKINCGRCEKCLRTCIDLFLVGGLGRCNTLPNQLDYRRIANIHIEEQYSFNYFNQQLEYLKEHSGDQQLEKAIQKALRTTNPWNRLLDFFAHHRSRLKKRLQNLKS